MKMNRVVLGLFTLFVAAAAWRAEAAATEKTLSQAREEYMGYRRMGIPVPGSQVAFMNPGDRVDVLVTFEATMQGTKKEKITATVLQNVIVADVKKSEKIEEAGAAELIVNPNEAQYLALSMMQGTIYVLVRAKGDTEMHPLEMASFRKLFR